MDRNILPMIPSTTKRFYQTVFQHHDNQIIGMFCLRSNELLSIDSNGGLKRLNIDTLISETLDLFGESKDKVTCVKANEEGDALFFGLETGAIWTSDLTTSDELIYSHTSAITAIASAKSSVFTAGLDMKIKMFNLKTQAVVANIDCVSVVNILHPLSNIYGLPLVVSDVSGVVSIWSPHILKSSTHSVQLCCQLPSKILSICQVNLFQRACIVCTTNTQISIYAIAVKKGSNDKDHISLLSDEIYSLVRTISQPDENTQFLSCITMNYTPTVSSNSSTSSQQPSFDMNVNSILLCACSDGCVYQVEPLCGTILRKFWVTNKSNLPCLSLIYLPSYQMFAATDSEDSLYLINYSATPLVTSIPITSPPLTITSSSSSSSSPSPKVSVTCAAVMDIHSTIIVYGDSNGQLHLYSNLTHESHAKRLPSITATTAICLIYLNSSDELIIISGHSNGTILFYICSVDGIYPSLENSRHQQISAIYNSKICSILNISKDTIATCSEMGSIILWKLNSKGMIKVTQLIDSLQMLSMIYHPDGYLIASDPTHQLHVWNSNQNWKKIGSISNNFRSNTTTSSPRSSLITSRKHKLGLYYDKKKGIHYITTATTQQLLHSTSSSTSDHHNTGENKIKFYKIVNCNELLLDGIIELPIQCSDIVFWNGGESSLVFIQSAIEGKIFSINMESYDSIHNFIQSRDFISYNYQQISSQHHSLHCEIIAITGNTSPIVLTCETLTTATTTSSTSTTTTPTSQYLQVWNNDLHDLDQFYYSSVFILFNHINQSLPLLSIISPEYLYQLIESHPHYPASLMIPEITSSSSQSFFFNLLLNDKNSPFLQPLLYRYLSKVPLVVTHSCYTSSTSGTLTQQQSSRSLSQHTLLSLALQYNDIFAIDLILSQWMNLLSIYSPSNPSTLGTPPHHHDPCTFQYHVMELFPDYQLLAYLQPAKFSQFIQQLPLCMNHSIIQKNYLTHKAISFSSPSSALFAASSGTTSNEEICMMRGTEYRVIPSFWSSLHENSSNGSKMEIYPDLMSRLLSPEDEKFLWQPFEQPHDCKDLQQIHTIGIEHKNTERSTSMKKDKDPSTSNQKSPNPPKSLLSMSSSKLGQSQSSFQEGKYYEIIQKNSKIPIEEGILVQSYVHPIPYAAAGIEFLSLCYSTHHLLGGSNSTIFLSSSLITTIIDYKWNSYYSKSYYSRILHSLFLLILFSFYCIYSDILLSTPEKTGLPILVYIVSIFLIINYILLFIDLILRLVTEKSYMIPLSDPWFYIGLVAYFTSVTGISMILLLNTQKNRHENDENNDDDENSDDDEASSSFNARCVLSAASLFLFLQFLSLLMPIPSIGLFIHRLFLTLQYTLKNYLLLLFCIISFSISFNLMHYRHSKKNETGSHGDEEDDLVTYNSFYGSFLQSFIYLYGGYDASDIFSKADSPLIMSLYFPFFIILIIWILMIYLLITMNEIFHKTELKAICLWRENQIKIILLKSFLIHDEISENIFHNPKWLHVLKPLTQQEYSSSSSSSSSSSTSSPSSSTSSSIDDIRKDVELLKDLFYQLQDTLHGYMNQQSLVYQQMNTNLILNSNYNEAQLLEKIKRLLQQHCHGNSGNMNAPTIEIPHELTVVKLPPKEDPIPPPSTSPRESKSPNPPLNTRVMSRTYSTTDNDDLRPATNDSSPNPPGERKGTTNLRVRQIKSSKKKLTSKIMGLDFDQSS